MSSYIALAGCYDQFTREIDYPARAAYFDRLLRTHTANKNILLDLACGTGSLSEAFAELGYDVIGVDASAEMLAVAMDKQTRSGTHILYLQQRMEELDLYGTVEAAVCALDGLNHLTDLHMLQRALQRVALFLAPEGCFIFDVNTPYKHDVVLANHTFVYENDDYFLVWRNTALAEHTTRFDLDLFTRSQGGYLRSHEAFMERGYTETQLADCLREAGLRVLAVYAADTEQPPDETTQRLVYVTKKER